MTNINFNASEHTPNSYELVAPGEYKAIIDESSKVATKAGDGFYLKLRLRIIEGDYAKRVIFSILNLWNKNETAKQIAQGDLCAICIATGVHRLEDTQQLHGKPMWIKVKIRPGKDGYDDQNTIAGYKALEGENTVPDWATTSETSSQPTSSKQSDDVPDWARGEEGDDIPF